MLAVAEIASGAEDEEVLRLARSQSQVLLTEDKDFGQLVFAAARESAGVVLIRWPVQARGAIGVTIVDFVEKNAALLSGAFAVIEPGRVRISRAP